MNRTIHAACLLLAALSMASAGPGNSNVPGKETIDIWGAAARPTCTADILDATLDFIRGNKDQPLY